MKAGRMLLIFVALSTAGMTSPSRGQTSEDQKTCASFAAGAGAIISACTILIESKRAPPKTIAWYHFLRGFAYMQIADFDHAAGDYRVALAYFPGNQYNLDQALTGVNWLRYLKELQNEGDYANWSGPPLDGFWSNK